MSMEHRKSKASTLPWFIIALIPILNLYWVWKVTRVLVEHKEI